MLSKDILIPTDGKPIEAFAMYGEKKPAKALLILPGKGYTINHFLLDFIWRMAAEKGFLAMKAEYRGFTYRHMGEPYELEHAAQDAGFVFDYLNKTGYVPEDIIVCAKSLGTLALAQTLARKNISIDKAILLTPVLYLAKEADTLPVWYDYKKRVKNSILVFGNDDPYCDMETAMNNFPGTQISYYSGADHGLHLDGDYSGTIEIQREIVETAKKFVTE